jgi:hypothetical protein
MIAEREPALGDAGSDEATGEVEVGFAWGEKQCSLSIATMACK